MWLGTRTQYYRSLAVVWLWYEKAYRDDQEFTVEDIPETLIAGGALAFIWSPQIGIAVGLTNPVVATIEVVAVTGLVASYAIGGREGVENYIDFITEPTKIPGRIAFTAETIYEHKIEKPLVAAAEAYVGWVDRRIEELKFAWSITQPRSLLPF